MDWRLDLISVQPSQMLVTCILIDYICGGLSFVGVHLFISEMTCFLMFFVLPQA